MCTLVFLTKYVKYCKFLLWIVLNCIILCTVTMMISVFILAVSTAEELGRLSITNLSLEVTESLSVYAAIFFFA